MLEQIMTSFPVHGNLLLSPLPDDLAYLTEKEKLKGESKPRFLLKGGGPKSSNGSDSARGEDKVLGGKKSKSFEKKNLNDKDIQNGIGEKETDIDTLACEELVANALLSNSYSNVDNSAKGTAKAVDNFRVANKVKEGSFSNLAEGNTLEAVSTQEIGLVEKPSGNVASADKLWEDKKADFHNDISVYPRKEGNFKGERADVSSKTDSNVCKGRKTQNAEFSDPLEQKASKKPASHEEDDMQLASGKEHSSSGGKKKSKGSQSHSAQGAEVPKDSSRMDSSLVPKNKKSVHANNYLSKSEIEDSKLQKDNGKARNRYRDFFGDIELEDGDNNEDSAEMLSIEKPKTFESVERSTFASNSTLKERLNGKKMDKASTSEAYSKEALNAAPITGNGSISDAAPGTLDPLANDNWVCCDKCQKWRLLPLGTNPESLPKKWLCSMLNWLPGMNRCSISEEETTKALMSLYQVPAPDKQINQHCHRGGVLPGLSMTDDSRFDQNHQSLGFHAVPKGGKKKNRIKEVLTATSQDGPPQLFNSMKKNLQAAVKSRSLNGVNQSPVANEIEPMYLNKSSVVEKHRHKQKEKNKLLERHSDGGETRSSKIKSKWDTDQDCFRISKKIKLDGHLQSMGWESQPIEILEAAMGCRLSTTMDGNANDQHKDDYHSLKDRKCEADNGSKGPPRNPKCQFQVTSDDGSPYMEKIDDKGVTRKRKMEHTSENIHRKEMKASVSKSEGKETSTSKGSYGTMRKGRSTKEQQMGPNLGGTLSQRSLDAMDSLRRDLGSVEVSGRGKSHSLPPSGRGQNETRTHSLHLNLDRKENGGNSLLIDAYEGDDALKASKHTKRSRTEWKSPIRSRQPTINGHRVRDADATIPARRDSSCQAATNIVKEAKDLKHSADHLKAALKFLHGASLLESGNGGSAKQGEMIRSMQMYSSTAKLCEFCAHEYEKSKDIAAAALAYKCMEVAYMRVIYYSHTNASRDRHELQTALQIVPPGEYLQLQDVNFAIEASRKSQIAFAAANTIMEEAQHREGITYIKRAQHREDIISVKRALDFSFQDVDGLLRLVRLAMEAISR
ncbi:MORC family CW-type zinc finger protein 4 [Camellia lanceoleosa]|uniref:MORC family CW-type zinc finger protein 4 n=1 Tax=Camellia lanceoleosa TaxID=1840588 RepID=A0ACC0F2C9_9ERIC|nr:MORC family CW-type zinc finger protein 4 [Camellia lanceoleosa]